MGFKPEELAIVLEEAKQYTDSQRLAHIETKTLITAPNSPIVSILEANYYKISDTFVDLSGTKEFVFVLPSGQEKSEYPRNFVYEDIGVIQLFTDAEQEEMIFVISAKAENGDVPEGVYVLISEHWFLKKIIIETVHQIDQKFIPNTVINLCDYGINLYEFLEIAVTTGKLSGAINVDACKDNFWSKIPRDGSQFAIKNDDGVNPPLVFYEVFVGLDKDERRYGTLSTKGTIHHRELGVIIDLFMCVSPRFNASSGACTGSEGYYILKLNQPPT